jgi:hypothetical protein
MASLASSAVTILASYRNGGMTGKRTLVRRLQLALTGQGGTTNKIDAATLGFNSIEGCTNLVDTNNNRIYPAVPSIDGSILLLSNPLQATDANRADAADLTIDPAVITVWGT